MRGALHPLTWWVWAGSLAVAIVTASSILLAIIVVTLVALTVHRNGRGTAWSHSFRWALIMGMWVVLIRTAIGVLVGVPIPGRTLFSIPVFPLPTWMAGVRVGGGVTLERLTSTTHESIIIAGVIALIGAATSLSNPHRLLRSLPIMIYEFGVAVVIATTVVPQLVMSITRIRQAQQMRGQSVRGIRQWKKIALPLLEDALSRSLDLAAAMDSRGYGFSRKRSRYRVEKIQSGEYGIACASIFAIFIPIPFVIFSALLPLLVVKSRNQAVFA